MATKPSRDGQSRYLSIPETQATGLARFGFHFYFFRCQVPNTIFGQEAILYPLHVNMMHWALGVFNVTQERLEFYDSYRSRSTAELFFKNMTYVSNSQWVV